MKQKWEYDKRLEAYVFGTQTDGGGVFQDGGEWFGNAVVGDIFGVGPYSTREECQKEVEKEYDEKKAS